MTGLLMRIAVALSTLAFAGLSFAQNISIGTGGTGGVYYPMGGGLAAVLSKYVPGMQATAEVTGGSVDNLKLIGTGKPYVGFSMSDAALDAYEGQDKFKAGGKVPVRTLAVLYPNRMHVVTVEGKGIGKFADLKGKRVSTGSPGSGTEVMAIRILEAYGISTKDIVQERLSVSEAANALKDKKILPATEGQECHDNAAAMALSARLEQLGLRVLVTDTLMKTEADRARVERQAAHLRKLCGLDGIEFIPDGQNVKGAATALLAARPSGPRTWR